MVFTHYLYISLYYVLWFRQSFLWILASLENPAYLPVVINFAIFFCNDMYGFISWKRRDNRCIF